MAELDVALERNGNSVNGSPCLETKLRRLFTIQGQLREQLNRTRAELDQVNREVLQVQEEYCTDAEHEEEYNRCLQRVLGIDQHFDPELVAEAEVGGQTFGEIIEEMERQASLSPSKEDR